MQEMQTGTVAENGGRQAGASGASSNVSGLSSLNNPFATNVAPMLQKAAFSGKPAATHDITTNMNQSTGNFGTNKVTIGVHSLQKVGPRLRAEGNMIPPASDAATLRRQVAALQSDLEAHMESEQYLQSINQQLRERLELYMKQNHENVERAESELNTLHEDMEQTLELQQRLAQRASCLEKEKKDLEQALQNRLQEFEVERSSLQNQINNLSEDLKRRTDSQFRAKSLQAELECALIAKKKLEEELHGSCAEADALKLKTEEYCNELKELVAKEKRIELVDFCCRKSLLRRFFKRLKEAIKEQCLADVCEQAAASFSKRSSSKRGFQALRLATHRASQIRRAHNRHAKAFSQWRQSVTQHQAEARAVLEVNAALKRAAMVFWRDHHVLQAIKKKKEMKAIIHLKRRVQKAVRGLLACWWEEMASRRRANQLSQLLALRRRRSLLVTALHSWMHATFDNLLVANTKYHSELLDAKAQCDEQKLQTTAVDVENLKLIDQLHSLSSEVALLKTNINEKNSQEDELHRALEDGAVIEDSLRGELEQQNEWIKELELKVRELQAKLQTKNAEDTVEDVQHSLQLRSLEKALKELRSQYEQRCMQANSYEKALKETAEKLEGASDESQEKLSSAFEIAASLRKLLEDRESHFATLEGNCRRKELELGEIQRKLASANNTFCETVEVRDARINELENLLVHKQTEMLEAQQQLQDLQLALDAKENRVRKLEYGIKLKLERDSNRPRSYLSSWIPPAAHSEPRPLFQNNLHLAQAKETMRHLCSQTKTTLQDDMDYESNIAESRELNDWRLLMSHESKFSGEGASAEIRHNSTSDDDEEDMRPQTGVNISPSSSCSPRASTQLDQRSSSSKSPSTVAGAEGSPSGLNQEKLSVANLSRHNKYAGITQDKDPGAEDSLQCEIERLQARIMSRLRDSSPTDKCQHASKLAT
ncbi:hypothetical protein O6H91_03G104200 [Diphasiastrum complanatum]|uniref:Uncharacterized protein n=1 Tax=Diphasiastrum complanatum TaxID=34168 RepID=A0ACC2E9V8_DIPCM|nr:hypothetical protein O6H91_03G104200 [Diphasiastrum complanatum]